MRVEFYGCTTGEHQHLKGKRYEISMFYFVIAVALVSIRYFPVYNLAIFF